MKSLIKNLNLTLKIIGWLQIIGGVTGLGLMAYLLLRTETINGPVLLIFLTGISLFIFSIHCGILLLKADTRKQGIILSLVNQGLQFVQWCLFGTGIAYSSGVNLSFGLSGSSFDAKFGIMSAFSMNINSGDGVLLKVNIAAILIFVVLIKLYKEINRPQQPEDLVIESGEMSETNQPL